MLANKIIKQTQTYGRSNIPRYLYHITTKNNYNSMMKDGFIKMSQDVAENSSLRGLFMFDMRNFTKRWAHIGVACNNWTLSLAKALILKASPDIVLLKIPTKNLFLNQLKCRIQNNPIHHDFEINGIPAVKQKHYTRKKQALEYIYQENVPIEYVEKIGETNTKLNLQDITNYKKQLNNMNVMQILSELCKNQPERKCIQVAKNNSSKFKSILNTNF